MVNLRYEFLNRRREWLLAAAILLITFLVFSSVLNHGFVDWDDDVNVTENPNVKELNATTLKNIFTGEVIGGYTPLTTLSFAIEHAIFGMKPGVFHTTNLLLHLVNTLLVFILIRRLGFSLFVAAFVALLFGIHPMRVESVAWITERKDLLYGMFFLASLIVYTRFRQHGHRRFYYITLLLFVLSLLSKIQAVTLPLVLILIDYLQERRLIAKQLLNKIPFLALSLLTGVIGILLLSQRGSLEINSDLPFYQRIFVGTYSLCVYLYKAVVPYPLSAIYPMPASLSATFYLSAGMVLILLVAAWRFVRKKPEWVFALLFFVVNVVFMLQVVGAGTAFLADRFTYLAYIGLFIILAMLAEQAFRIRWPLVTVIPVAIWVIIMSLITWFQVKVWKDSETLFTNVIDRYPNSLIAHNNLGIFFREQGQIEKAVAAYTRAIAVSPGGYLAYSNRGEVYFETGEWDKALVDINRALELNPDNSKALGNRAAIFGSRKQYDEALADLNRALELDPANQRARSNRVLAHYTLGRYEAAVNDATIYLKTNPTDPDMLNQRGRCYGYLNRNEEALSDFNQAIRLNPRKGSYYQNRSYQLSQMGNFKSALEDILKARELGIKVNPNYLQMLQER